MKYLIVVILLIVLCLPVAGQNCDTIEIKKENREYVGEMFFEVAWNDENQLIDDNGKSIDVDSLYLSYVYTDSVYTKTGNKFYIYYNLIVSIDTYYYCYTSKDELFKIGALRNVYDSQTGEFLGQDFVGWIILND